MRQSVRCFAVSISLLVAAWTLRSTIKTESTPIISTRNAVPYMTTTTGEPITDVFARYDAKQSYPHIDLIVPVDHRAVALLHAFFLSVDLFWPRGIGRKVLILDKGQSAIATLVTAGSGWEVVYEDFPSELQSLGGWLRSQWSALNSEKWSSAKYLAYCDLDSPFSTKVTPDLLFAEGEKIRIIGNYEWQQKLWGPSFRFWLNDSDGKEAPYINSMTQLPQLWPRDILKPMRQFFEQKRGASFTESLILWNRTAIDSHMAGASMVAHYALKSDEWKWRFVLVNEAKDAPVLRFAVHIPYMTRYSAQVSAPPAVMVGGVRIKTYNYDVYYSLIKEVFQNGICLSTPPGLVEACPEFLQSSSAVDTRDETNWYWEYSVYYHWPKTANRDALMEEVWNKHFHALQTQL
jgi:hypothetical protein